MSKKEVAIKEENGFQVDFLPFANSDTSNVIDQAQYVNLQARGTGFIAGVAQSAQLNKVWRQSSLMSAALAQFISVMTQSDVIDDGNVAGLADKLSFAIGGAGVPKGGIMMWSGALNAIPDKWALCDGQNGRPDLRDRFVLGAGGKHGVGEAGGSNVISVEQMPSHNHAVTGSVGEQSNDHTHHLSGSTAGQSNSHAHGFTTSAAGGHSHGVSDGGHAHGPRAGSAFMGVPNQGQAGRTDGGQATNFGATADSGANIGIQGVGDHAHSGGTDAANADHSHAFNSDTGGVSAGHTHSLSVNSEARGGGAEYLPPFFALAYIIKL